MAVPHYAYLKIKMSGNNGTNITVHGSFSRSDNCDREFQRIAAKFGMKQEAIDFSSKQLTSQEDDKIKKLKKKPDDPALGVSVVGP
jgi:murein L,D-transpeptidase YafK